jgi:hypothetical protein
MPDLRGDPAWNDIYCLMYYFYQFNKERDGGKLLDVLQTTFLVAYLLIHAC